MENDIISRQVAIDALKGMAVPLYKDPACEDIWERDRTLDNAIDAIRGLPSAQPEIVRCKDCKFYSPMNRETKTGICNLIMHQNFGDNWFCAGAERRPDESDRKRRCQMVGGMQKEGLHE